MGIAGVVAIFAAIFALVPAAAVFGVDLPGSTDEAAVAFHGPFLARAAMVLAATLAGVAVAAVLAWPAFRGAALIFGLSWAGLLTDETWDVALARTAYILATVALVTVFVWATRRVRSLGGEPRAPTAKAALL
jgi:hypothetical protein